MTLKEIFQNVINKKIKLDANGHDIEETKYLLKDLKDRLDHELDGANGKFDGTWSVEHFGNKTVEEVNESMRNLYSSILNREINIGSVISGDRFYNPECYACGEKLYWQFQGDKLILNHIFKRIEEEKGRKWEYTLLENGCKMNGVKSFKADITIQSPFIFTNYFISHTDSPVDEKYSRKYSLNTLLGRKNVTEYKANIHNMAYGQMGNMSIGIYVSKNNDNVIVASPYLDEYIHDKNLSKKEVKIAKDILENYIFKGQLSLEMWRWEGIEENSLSKNDLDFINKKEVKSIKLDLPHGRWDLEHFYDFYDRNNEPIIYSQLTLFKDSA